MVCLVFPGELENAQSTVQRCLELDPTSVDAHLLMAQIYLAQSNFAMCSHCLELGVSHNFQVGVLCARHPLSTPKPSWLQSPLALGERALELPASLRSCCWPKGGGRLRGLPWCYEPHPLLCSRSETTPSTTSSRPGPSTSLGTIQKPSRH